VAKSSTRPAICKLCKHEHSAREPHIWLEEPKDIVATLKKKVRTISKKVRTIEDTPEKVRTIRQVSLKEINRSASKHFKDLPFLVTRNGVVIARVEGVK